MCRQTHQPPRQSACGGCGIPATGLQLIFVRVQNKADAVRCASQNLQAHSNMAKYLWYATSPQLHLNYFYIPAAGNNGVPQPFL